MEYDIFRPSEHVRPIARKIYDNFVKEQSKRKFNKNWIEDELQFLWKETCNQRALVGKGPVSFEKIKSAELCAAGHIDYTTKCALYCDDLVNEE